MNENQIKGIEDCISKIKEGFPSMREPCLNKGNLCLYHYTPFEKLFSIMDSDSLWASRSRFSNDSTEDKVLGEEWIKKEQYYGDNYIVSFCEKDDILSQWRGYCPKGGVSIGFMFPRGYSTYTLLLEDYKGELSLSGENIELYKNRPLPVIYCKLDTVTQERTFNEDFTNFFKEIEKSGTKFYDIAPYLKNNSFDEERELRLVFNNSNREIEKCIRFRKLDDGSMIPYIVVKFGNLLENGRSLLLTYDESTICDIFKQHIESMHRKPIIIPCGKDQSDVCNSFSKKIRDYKKQMYRTNRIRQNPKIQRWINNPLKIICDGHLPIISITVSPSPKQEYMKEVIERFCRSKYWLQNVEVKCSKIPYVASKL